MPLWAGLTHSLPLSLSPTTMRDSRNTGIRSQTCLPRERVSIAVSCRFSMCESWCIRCTNPLRKFLFSRLTPPLYPFAILTPARIRTVGGCYTRSFIYIHLLHILHRTPTTATRLYTSGSGPGWGGGVQVGFRLAGTCILQHRALGDCVGRTRDAPGAVIYLGSRLALSPKWRSSVVYIWKKRGSSSRAMRCARRFLFRSFYE